MMAVVLCVAFDFAIGKAAIDWDDPFSAITLAILPTTSLLLIALTRLRRGGVISSFWVGFEIFGWLSVMVFVVVACFLDEFVFAPIYWVEELLPFPRSSPQKLAGLIAFCLGFYTIVLLPAAIVGGRFLSRYRIVVERIS